MAVGARTSCNALTQCSVVGRDAPCGRSCGSGPTTFAMAPWSCMREIVLTCAPRKIQHRRHVRGSRAAMHTTCHAASSVPPLFALPPKVQIVGGSAAPPARGTTARGVRFEPPTCNVRSARERGENRSRRLDGQLAARLYMLSLYIALPLGVAARAAAVEVLLCSRVEVERGGASERRRRYLKLQNTGSNVNGDGGWEMKGDTLTAHGRTFWKFLELRNSEL